MRELEYSISFVRDGRAEEVTVITGDIHGHVTGTKRPGQEMRDVVVSVIDRDPVFPARKHFVDYFRVL